jgi:hypothetical protein
VDEDDLDYLTLLAGIAVDVVLPIEQLLAAYRSAASVPFEAYDRASGAGNPMLVHCIGRLTQWGWAVPTSLWVRVTLRAQVTRESKRRRGRTSDDHDPGSRGGTRSPARFRP